jgi:hypothetical protein
MVPQAVRDAGAALSRAPDDGHSDGNCSRAR